jgi:dihydroxyacid dehydratase/phosphogluconate dehydratase
MAYETGRRIVEMAILVELGTDDWMRYGYDVPLVLNMQPAGKYLGERFHRAGGWLSVRTI